VTSEREQKKGIQQADRQPAARSLGMVGKSTVGDYVSLQRGTTYKGNLVGKPGPALLGLGSIHPGGGFRDGDFKTYGGECPDKLMLFPGDLFVSLKGATKDGKMIGSIARVPPAVPSGRLTQDTVKLVFDEADEELAAFLYWILRTPQYRDYCAARATGSAVVALEHFNK
jgi:type I restriction enzyme S subunit